MLQHARQHPLGHHLDAGARTDAALQPHAVADCLADLLAKALGHEPRRRPRRQTAGFEHDDFAATEPWLF